jgi:hypothetical protein
VRCWADDDVVSANSRLQRPAAAASACGGGQACCAATRRPLSRRVVGRIGDHLRFLTTVESEAWVRAHSVPAGEGGAPDRDPAHPRLKASLPPTIGQLLWFCRFVGGCLEPRSECLLWVTLVGPWRSSQNWHLYYRLRQSYGDQRLIDEAPDHLFLDFEEPEFVSFLQIGILAGWDMWLVPELDYGGADTARIFVSHDEWVQFFHRDESEIARWRTALEKASCRIL